MTENAEPWEKKPCLHTTGLFTISTTPDRLVAGSPDPATQPERRSPAGQTPVWEQNTGKLGFVSRLRAQDVVVPLETTYQAAYRGVAAFWRNVLEQGPSYR
jgi:hypothetical protein